MAKNRLTPADLDARLKFILGITLGMILFFTAMGILYALIFVTQPIGEQSENDKMFFNVLGSVATFITGTLAGLLIGNSAKNDQQPITFDEPEAPEAPAAPCRYIGWRHLRGLCSTPPECRIRSRTAA